jgi:hypothetical protein
MVMKVFMILFCLVATEVYSQSNECDLKRDKDGVKVYTCKSDYDKFKSLKAEFVLENTSIEKLEAFLRDVSNYPTWQYNMTEAKVLAWKDANELIYRSVIDAPWPLEDRELIMRFWSDDNQGDYVYFYMENTSFDYPIDEELIRVPFMKGQWRVKRTMNNSLYVEYFLRIDPGGTVPAWLVNIAMADGPHHSFRSLIEQLKKQSSNK